MASFGRDDDAKPIEGSGSASASSGGWQTGHRQRRLTTGQAPPQIFGSRGKSLSSRPIPRKHSPQACSTGSTGVRPAPAGESSKLGKKRQQSLRGRDTGSTPRRGVVHPGNPTRASAGCSHGQQTVQSSGGGTLSVRTQTQDLRTCMNGAHAQSAGEAGPGRTPHVILTPGSNVRLVPTVGRDAGLLPIPSPPQRPLTLLGHSISSPRLPRPAAGSSTGPSPSRASTDSSQDRHSETQAAAAGISRGPVRVLDRGMGPLRMTPSSVTAERPLASLPERPARKVRLGIEMEFLLAAKSEKLARPSVDEFVELFAENYNAQVAETHPRMVEYLMSDEEEHDYIEWSMVNEWTIGTQDSPWGVEMVTPILNVSTDPLWRKHVEVAWEHVRQDYHVTSHGSCGTHIHISLLPNYDLRDLQRIASSAIYFEPAIEALVPADRRQNAWVRSNWRHSPLLMRKGRSRLQSVEEIERATTKDRVISLMQQMGDDNFTWNFSHLLEVRLKQTIEFRKPPASMTSAEALSWAELTMTFVQASTQYGMLSNLRRFEVNVGGLLRFLKQVNVPGVNEPHRLQRIWAGRPLDAAWEP